MRDKIFSQKLEKLEAFKFDAQVADVFGDMISRSVPIYERVLQLLPLFLEKYLEENDRFLNQKKEILRIYDLGSSLGTTSFTVAKFLNEFFASQEVEFFLIDSSEAMIHKSQELMAHLNLKIKTKINFNFLIEDIKQSNLTSADFVLLNFTLQFLKLEDRDFLIDKIFRGLKSGGYLILSEKINFANTEQDFLQDLYWRFKSFNGYSDLEISQKRTALENVLITESLAEHKLRLEKAGFKNIFLWLEEFNFVSLVAIK